tara:strand:+ start:15724 stop:16077 length:354 start_codon:yes stop_codon:yes gene_type:complete
MEDSIRDALVEWESIDAESKACYLRLKALWEAKKLATTKIEAALEKNGYDSSVVMNTGTSRIRFKNSIARKPLTITSVRRGLARCVDGEDSVEAIISVIQEERGRVCRKELCRHLIK